MKKQKNGFTLIEMILVVVLLAITVGVTSDILISLVRSNTKTQVLNEIQQQANFISLKIEKELRDADDIDTTKSNSDTLVFTRKDETAITYHLDSANNVLQRVVGDYDEDSNPYVPITSNVSPGGVEVTCIDSECFSVAGNNPKVVKINLRFEQAQRDTGMTYSGSAEIRSSIVVRNTY